jgi:hypothetical protein
MAGEAIQIFGGNGYINEYPLGRLWRDAKLYEIGAGTSEIRRMLIGRELFANVANVVVHSDLNALSTIQFAVEHLKVEHIMVVGHYGCAGVRAAMRGARIGLADNWLRHVQDVRLRHRKRLDHLDPAQQEDILCEMNVIEQVGNVALSTVMQDAWARGQKVSVHGWVYGLADGLLKDLQVTMSRPDEVVPVFAAALKRYPRGPDGAAHTMAGELGDE